MEIMTRELPDGPMEGGNPAPARGAGAAPFGVGIPEVAAEAAREPARALRPRRPSADGGAGGAAARTQGLVDLAREGLGRPARAELEPEVLGGAVRAAVSRYAGPAAPGDVGSAVSRAFEDRLLTSAPVYARKPHWTEDPARVLADLALAAAGGRALALLTPPIDDWYGPALEAISEADGFELAVITDPHLDGLRALASVREVALECGAPDAGITGLAASLRQLREAATAAPSESASNSDGWFGEGVVGSPPAPVRIGPEHPATVLVGLDPCDHAAIPGHLRAVEAGDGSPASLHDAAREVAHLAFGPEALGGHAAGAASRVLVRTAVFSAFTEALLEALDEGFESGALGAPAWSSERPHRLTRGSELAVELARKVGIEEGATLVFERKRRGELALVFTNVEPRMALAGRLGAPCLLALQRAGATI